MHEDNNRGKQNDSKESLNEMRARQMVQVLNEKIDEVGTVHEWANETNVTRSSLYRIVTKGIGKTPIEILKEAKFEKIVAIIRDDFDACAYSVAMDSGFGSEAALRMFLQRRYDTNISTIRRRILSGDLQID